MSAVIGADIGGTFTDVVLTAADGRLHVAKRLTTPRDPGRIVGDYLPSILVSADDLALQRVLAYQHHPAGIVRAVARESLDLFAPGIGFDETSVELIADPDITRNVHEVFAEGDFGCCEFRIEGQSLPDNPRSSAITAMSVVREILNPASPIVI